MTCRCPLCGAKCAGRPIRGSYIRAGVRVDEDGILNSAHKRQGRRQRRFREKLRWMDEYDAEVEEGFRELMALCEMLWDDE